MPLESAPDAVEAAGVTGVDPIAVFCRSRERERFLWLAPAAGRARVALGVRASVEAHGEQRFAEAAQAARVLLERHDSEARAGLPLVGGFAFSALRESGPEWSDFPDLRFSLPERLLEIEAGRARWLGAEPLRDACASESAPERSRAPHSAANAALTIESDEAPAAYRGRVAAALREIERGEFEKVVVARRLRVRRPGGFELEPLLRALAARYPSCTLFAIARAETTFLGASPEPLLRLRDGVVETAALAGSTARGRSPEEDRELARALLESKKEQAEHAAVLRALRAALAPVCSELQAPEAPGLRRLDGIQHLESRVRARLAQPISLLELAARLHPTPSIAGAPTEAALRWLARHEQLARGWYAGGVGCVDAHGEGELCVALRCALFRGDEALLYAGAGVVAGSQPEAEVQETRLKLRALLDPLLEV